MKQLTNFINEAKEKYKISDSYKESVIKITNELQKLLPEYPNYDDSADREYKMNYAGKFAINKYDIIRYPVETSKYIGYNVAMKDNLSTYKNDISYNNIVDAFERMFNFSVKESIFDDNLKISDEYDWVSKIHSVLCKFFNTKDLSKVKLRTKKWGYILSSSDIKDIKDYPTVKKDGFFVSLYGVDIYNIEMSKGDEININLQLIIYEEKGPEKVKQIKAVNAAKTPKDCIGRDLMVGDTVAYSVRGIADGWNPLPTGTITKTSTEQVEVNGRKVYGFRCCLISRKDGKKIE